MSTRRRIGILSTLLLLAVAGMPAIAQTWSEVVAAYERGDYATAYRGFRRHAEQGDDRAQIYLGVMYYDGDWVSQDYAESVKWFRRAADKGNYFAQFILGGMYADGLGIVRDDGQALEWLRRAAEQDDGAVDALHSVAEDGHALFQLGIALMYAHAPSSASGLCTTRVVASLETTPKPRSCSTTLLNKATKTLNSAWRSCTTRAKASPRMMCKPTSQVAAVGKECTVLVECWKPKA